MNVEEDWSAEPAPILCGRCAVELQPGRGHFFRINIEAVADPTPPEISDDEDHAENFSEQIELLLARTEQMSDRELMDQVYRRLTMYLCSPCSGEWIENPAR